jgi:hypothetical protein
MPENPIRARRLLFGGQEVCDMAKGSTTKGMHGKADRKARGRTNIGQQAGPRATRPAVPERLLTEANRPQTPGGTKHRGDRRDTSKLYTNNAKHSARGNNARPDVKTRAR